MASLIIEIHARRAGGDRPGARLGVGSAVRVTHDMLRGATDQAQRAELLDAVAGEAARGSRDAVELLVWAIDELALARPAIRGVLIDEADVDDVAQDVLVAVAETIGRFRGDARFTTWLHKVARFKAIDHLRRKRDQATIDEAPGDAQRISSLLASRATLQDALNALPEHYRSAVVLRDVQQRPYTEVAAQLGINLNTAKSRVARGRALLAGMLVEREQ
jgi:RNA polymerase sigma-70 factor, ECF subfamily